MQNLYSALKQYQLVLWDWNGTLLDDVDIAVSTMQEILEDHRLPEITTESYRKNFRFPVRHYYESLGFNFSATPFEHVSDRFISGYKQRVKHCQLHSGAKHLLTQLKQSGIRQRVLSAARLTDLVDQLQHFDIHDVFEAIHGLDDHHAHGKLDLARRVITHANVDRQATILVGDTDHDLEIGKELGIHVLLFGDGHQDEQHLHKLHHHVVIR